VGTTDCSPGLDGPGLTVVVSDTLVALLSYTVGMSDFGQPIEAPPRIIGYWWSEKEPDWPDVRQFVDAGWDAGERDGVIAYLTADIWASYRYGGDSSCRLCQQPNGSAEPTDGVFRWPEGLAHYVADHDVRLPAVFVDHALGRSNAPDLGKGWWMDQETI